MRWNAGRVAVAVLSVAVYAAAVMRGVQRAQHLADLRGCVELHAALYQVILLAGLALGLAAGPVLAPWATAAARALMPEASPARRTGWVRRVAVVALVLSTASSVLWTNAGLNLFIDSHRIVLVEADVLLYAMGAISGIAWYLLLDRHGWLGVLLMPAMAFMIVSAAFTGSGWC